MATLNGRSRPVLSDVAVHGDRVTLRVDWQDHLANWLEVHLTRAEMLALLAGMDDPDASINTADGVITVS